jgi:hypothetical protein
MWKEAERTLMFFRVLILLIIILLNTDGFTKERNPAMGIVLVIIGKVDPKVIGVLKNDLTKVFGKEVQVANPTSAL